MSTVFKEFLHDQAQKHQTEAEAGKATVDEWRAAIQRLFAQIRGWLKDSDPQNLIEIKESQEEIREPGLGLYSVPRLDLRAFGKWIGIIPKARKTVGTARPPQKLAPERATGRVDITDELRRYILYRFQEGDHDTWMIDERLVDEDQEGRPGVVQYIRRPDPKPFDQAAFERALMTYLR